MPDQFKKDFENSCRIYKIETSIQDYSYIYALMDDKKNILYLGRTSHINQAINIKSHKMQFTKWMFFPCRHEDAPEILLKLYEKYRPPLNKVPPNDPGYSGLDTYKDKNKDLKGQIKFVRKFLRENPVKTRGGRYPIKYLDRMLLTLYGLEGGNNGKV
jgi:hypothetical protein